MKRFMDFLRTTIVGGVMFLLPLFLLYLVFGKAMQMASGLVHPLVVRTGLTSIAGIAAATVLIIAGMVVGAFIAGLFGRTAAGQAFLQWIENGIASSLPQFGTIQGLANSLDGSAGRQVQVVLVPADAGWVLGFTFEAAQGDWFTVFLPGSPQWSGGSIVYAHADQVHLTGLTMMQAIGILRSHGIGSAPISARLAELKAQGALG